MPKRTDINSILIIGAGPIVIGQACEFDYSGTQACKALKSEGYRVILVNSNPATIMTDPELADATYIEPITPEFVTKIIEKEKPDALLPTMGGQTALNTALKLHELGVLEKHKVKLIGASIEAIEKAENRKKFNEAMKKIGLECPKHAIAHSLEEAIEALKITRLPAIIRPSFTLGGTGGGIAHTEEEFKRIVLSGLDASPTNEVLIDESILGWKEYEMEVVRDKKDNCIIICSIENIDPMGTHTGDSVTVAPALTLTDKEYQKMRNASISILREIGVETGGSNVQFAVNPENGKMLVIEMNPRVSRSSALASKATGFPIAKVAAKLAIGYTLDEIMNDCTGVTPASFEPTIDYVVTKIPRFTFEKFPGAEAILGSAMKSVGEVMAIGGNFAESLQKALRSLETGLTGLDEIETTNLKEELKKLSPNRTRLIAQGFRENISLKELHELTKYDPWFLEQIEILVKEEENLKSEGREYLVKNLSRLKSLGFSDQRIANLTGFKAHDIQNIRHTRDIRPVYKRVDTCAAEFASLTPYMYSTYTGDECESEVSKKKKVIILGSGPNRIGQGIEFDYACVHAAYAMKEAGYEAIMVNCNPETVSTDYDTSDRLYFEPLTDEDIIELVYVESKKGKLHGVIAQFGGQTPLKLVHALKDAGIPIIGTSPDSIDLAEDRERFQKLLRKLGLKQPENAIGRNEKEVINKAEEIGYPLVVRPSYVLGGRNMAIIYDKEGLEKYLLGAKEFFANGPLLLDRFLKDAAEIDVDAICDAKEVYIAGVLEHIEEAGIHSGDSACALPPYSLSKEIVKEIEEQTRKLAFALDVVGLMNVQYAVKDNDIYVLEVNPRASRTVPFIAKATGVPVAKIAARVMAGEKLKDFKSLINKSQNIKHVAVKESVFPFARFQNVDVLLGPEMKSTGEVMGIDHDFASAFAKAQFAAGTNLPKQGTIFISVRDSDKKAMIPIAKNLTELGYKIISTKGTADFLRKEKIEIEAVNKVQDGSPHIVDHIKQGKVQLVMNTTEGVKSIADSFSIRRTALMMKIPYTTTVAGSREIAAALKSIKSGTAMQVEKLQNYLNPVTASH